jgi:arylsulfate sulfotransferase
MSQGPLCGRDSLDQDWPAQHVPAGQRPYDWDHANAVVYDEASDAYYVSLRHQDAVIKVSRTDEKLIWILGTPANWVAPWQNKLLAPVGDLLWPFHQHAVELNPIGIGLYDNGNYRAAAFAPVDTTKPEYSRAVIYAVDEAAKTVSQVWSYGPPSGADAFFSSGMGDCDRQPVTGNVLITNSQRVAQSATATDTTYAQIIEVTPDGSRVFELTTLGKEGSVYPVYRADRIPDIRR